MIRPWGLPPDNTSRICDAVQVRRSRANTPRRLHVGGTVTEITSPILPKSIHYSELQWTWLAGSRNTLRLPMSRKGQRPEWQVCCGDDLISFGRWGGSPGWQTFLRIKGLPVEWELDGQVLLCELVGCCGGEVHRDGNCLRNGLAALVTAKVTGETVFAEVKHSS